MYVPSVYGYLLYYMWGGFSTPFFRPADVGTYHVVTSHRYSTAGGAS